MENTETKKRKQLKLVLKRKWFDMIFSGIKSEEYRDITDYWIGRICEKVNGQTYIKEFDSIIFYHAYSKDRDQFEVEVKGIHFGKGLEIWGAKKGVKYFVLKLGEILNSSIKEELNKENTELKLIRELSIETLRKEAKCNYPVQFGDDKIDKIAESKAIHTTIGVYANGSYKINGVQSQYLKNHIEYNFRNRLGRALFLNGICLYRGYLDKETTDEFEQKIKENNEFIRIECTAPYQ